MAPVCKFSQKKEGFAEKFVQEEQLRHFSCGLSTSRNTETDQRKAALARNSLVMEIPAINLKAIVLVHWLLTVWGSMVFLPQCYAWGNFSILAVGVWAIAQRDSIDAVLLFLMGMILTILTDIVIFGIFYPLNDFVGVSRFSGGMAILNLLLKPASCFFVYQMYRERGGDYNVNFGFPSVSQNRDAYQSIDHQDESSSPANPFNQAQDSKPGVRSY